MKRCSWAGRRLIVLVVGLGCLYAPAAASAAEVRDFAQAGAIAYQYLADPGEQNVVDFDPLFGSPFVSPTGDVFEPMLFVERGPGVSIRNLSCDVFSPEGPYPAAFCLAQSHEPAVQVSFFLGDGDDRFASHGHVGRGLMAVYAGEGDDFIDVRGELQASGVAQVTTAC